MISYKRIQFILKYSFDLKLKLLYEIMQGEYYLLNVLLFFFNCSLFEINFDSESVILTKNMF